VSLRVFSAPYLYSWLLVIHFPYLAMSGSRPGRELHAGDLAPLVICPFCPLSTTNYGPIRSSG
jgi:hypothetical protein